MTKGDIKRQQGNPEFIEHLCMAIIREMQLNSFSLRYIQDKVQLLSVFVKGLHEINQ